MPAKVWKVFPMQQKQMHVFPKKRKNQFLVLFLSEANAWVNINTKANMITEHSGEVTGVVYL